MDTGYIDSNKDKPYGIIDGRTGLVVYRTTYKHRKRVRNRADKLDNAYGGYRYRCSFLEVTDV